MEAKLEELNAYLEEENQRIVELVGEGKDIEQLMTMPDFAMDLPPEEAALQRFLQEENQRIVEMVERWSDFVTPLPFSE